MLTAHSKQYESICYSCILSWGSVRMRDHFHLSLLASSNMGPWVSSWDCFGAGRVVNGQLLTDAPLTAVQPWPPGPCSHVLPLILGLSGLWLGCLFSPNVCVLNLYHTCHQYIMAHQTQFKKIHRGPRLSTGIWAAASRSKKQTPERHSGGWGELFLWPQHFPWILLNTAESVQLLEQREGVGSAVLFRGADLKLASWDPTLLAEWPLLWMCALANNQYFRF